MSGVAGLRWSQVVWWAIESAVPVCAQGIVAVLIPEAAALLLLGAPGTLATLAATVRSARAVGSPDGDLLLRSGVRLSSAAVLRQEVVGRWAAAVWGVVAVGDLVLAWPSRVIPALVPLVAAAAVTGTIVRVRSRQRRAIEAHLAVNAGRDADARRLLASLSPPGPDLRDAVEGLSALLAVRTGDGAAGLQALERRWSGGLDDAGVLVALTRASRTGDVALARRFCAAPREGSDPWSRYVRAQLEALVALAEGRAADALGALGPVDDPAVLPPVYRRQVVVLRAAATRAAGRAAEADQVLASLEPPLSTESWRREAQPWLWARVTGEEVRRPAISLPPPEAPSPSHPFAPPAEDAAAPPAVRARFVGAVPVDRMAVSNRQGGALARARLVAVSALLVVSPLLFGLGFLLAALDDDPMGQAVALLSQAVGLSGLVVGGISAAPRWFLPARPRPALALDDGRLLPVSWWWLFAARGLAPLLVWVLLAGLSGGFGWSAWAPLLVLPLLAWSAWRRFRGWRLLRDAHDPDPARMLAWTRPAFGPSAAQIGAWRALARLRAADAEGAGREAREASAHGADADFVLGWLAAARGEAELDRLLAAADPPGMAARYRQAVTLALAALAAGRADAVAARLSDWEALADGIPNVHGDLLARLVGALRRARGEAGGPDPAGTEWVPAVFPVAR